MHTRYVYIYIHVNLQEKYIQRTSVRTFGVMHDHTLFFACKSLEQASGHKYNGLSIW